jgi:hypothetical protein
MNAIETLRGAVRDYEVMASDLADLRARLKAATFNAARLQLAVPEILAAKIPAGDPRLLAAADDGELFLDEEGIVRLAITGTPVLNVDTLKLL